MCKHEAKLLQFYFEMSYVHFFSKLVQKKDKSLYGTKFFTTTEI